MEGMESGLAYILSIGSDGKIIYIAIVGIGENWDGIIEKFYLEPYEETEQ
jgi:hypothetical protein